MTEHSQETKIAILEAKVEHMMGHVKELTMRVRANEKVVAIVSAIGIGAGGIIGSTAFAPKVDASDAVVLPDTNNGDRVIVVQSDPTPGIPLGVSRRERENAKYAYRPEPYPGMLPDNSMTLNNWMGKMKQWELEQSLKDPSFDINSALAEYFNGSNDPTEQEELLQLQSDQDRQSIGWRYDRRDDRSWFRPLQKGESQSRWGGHTGEED